MRFPVLSLFVAAALLPPTASAAPAPSEISTLALQEARLATIGWRLTTASAGWCPETVTQPGWLLGDPRRFDKGERADAEQVYGTKGDGPFIAAVAPGSPAARAGLARGTRLAAIDGQPVPTLDDGATIRIDAAIVMLASHDPAAALTITDGEGRTHHLDAAPGCVSRFRIERSGVQAAANGKLVRVKLDLATSIVDDAELAAVVAHELAHNILHHPQRLAGNNPVSAVRASEIEADRLAVWLMADAGYDPAAAIRFWTRHKKPLIRAASHPPRAERIAAIEAEIAAMAAARAENPAAKPLELNSAFLFSGNPPSPQGSTP